jgi:hypothetical protein
MWSLYFPKDQFKEQSEAHQLVEKFLMIIENSDKKFDIVILQFIATKNIKINS